MSAHRPGDCQVGKGFLKLVVISFGLKVLIKNDDMGEMHFSVYYLFDSEDRSFLFSLLFLIAVWQRGHDRVLHYIAQRIVIVLDYGVMVMWWGSILSNLLSFLPCSLLLFPLIRLLALYVSCFPLYDQIAAGFHDAAVSILYSFFLTITRLKV